MRRLFAGGLVALTMAVVSAGCDKTPDTPTTPTTPTTTVTETFSGTIGPNGAQTFTFSTSAAGFLTATLKTLSPESAIQVGLALGTFNGVTCQTLIVNDTAVQGLAVTGNATAAGSLCVRIYDARSTVTQQNTFEIVVVHP